jgi:hypothetical protein
LLLAFFDASATISPFLVLFFFPDPAFNPRDFVDFLDCGLVWGGTGVFVEMLMEFKSDSVEDNVGVDDGVAVVGKEVFELPLLVLALEDFVDLEAGVADFDLVNRMLGRPNSVGSLKRVVSFGSAGWTEEVEG